jgi:hypothetical protein
MAKKSTLQMKEEHLDRNVDIFKRHLDGETYASSARLYGIANERVRQIIMKWFRILGHPYYREHFPYPFTRETHPHLWYTHFEGSKMWWLDRKKLKPEERAFDKNHWLNLLADHVSRHRVIH